MRELAREVDDAVDEVRALARGLLPPLLVERGIGDALREAAATSSVPATVRALPAGRYPPEIEIAVYFCCLEALQNAAKHAAGATFVTIGVWEKDALEFEVRDDGPGLAAEALERGAGLTNMRDRVAAVGGRLSITGAPGHGTWVAGAVPLALADVPEQAETLVRGATDALEDGFAIYRSVRDEAGTVVDFLVEYLNDAACAQLGRGREQLMGRTLGGVDHEFTASTDFRWLRQVLAWDQRDTRTAVEYERGPDTAHVIRCATELRAIPLGEGRLVVTWRDMTEEARTRAELRRRPGPRPAPAPSSPAVPGELRP